jgi:hypothetical protein
MWHPGPERDLIVTGQVEFRRGVAAWPACAVQPAFSRCDTAFVPALACAGLIGLWLLIDPRTADLAAAVYRSQLFARHGLTLCDNAWFGGHHLPGYSLISLAFGSLLGPRASAALVVLCSVVVFCVLAQRHAEPHARPAAPWFAVSAAGDLFIGRLAFALSGQDRPPALVSSLEEFTGMIT